MAEWLNDLQEAARKLDNVQWELEQVAGDIYRMFGATQNWESLDDCINALAATRMQVRRGTGKAVDDMFTSSQQASIDLLKAALVAWSMPVEGEIEQC